MNDAVLIIIAGLVGLSLGSFLNVVIFRFGSPISPWRGRSACPCCHTTLRWSELLPFLSFIVQGGRCRSCQAPIRFLYPIGELAIALMSILIVLTFGPSLMGLLWLLIGSIAWVLLWIDIRSFILPDELLIFLVLAVVFEVVLSGHVTSEQIALNVLGGLAAGGFLFTLLAVTGGRGMGFGDVKLGFILGFLVGWPGTIVFLSSAFFLGALVGIGLLLSHRRAAKDPVPFGPFLLLGAALAMLWGERLIAWFLFG